MGIEHKMMQDDLRMFKHNLSGMQPPKMGLDFGFVICFCWFITVRTTDLWRMLTPWQGVSTVERVKIIKLQLRGQSIRM